MIHYFHIGSQLCSASHDVSARAGDASVGIAVFPIG